MNKRIAGAIAAVSFGGAMLAAGGVASADKPSCNWGQLTKYAINEVPGYNQGEHSSDPSGDGRGPEARVGLPNVTGSLEDTCLFIESLLP